MVKKNNDEKKKIFSVRFRERWDCLSEEATDFILTHLRPRLVLSGTPRLPVYSLALYGIDHQFKKIPPLSGRALVCCA